MLTDSPPPARSANTISRFPSPPSVSAHRPRNNNSFKKESHSSPEPSSPPPAASNPATSLRRKLSAPARSSSRTKPRNSSQPSSARISPTQNHASWTAVPRPAAKLSPSPITIRQPEL